MPIMATATKIVIALWSFGSSSSLASSVVVVVVGTTASTVGVDRVNGDWGDISWTLRGSHGVVVVVVVWVTGVHIVLETVDEK